MRVTRLSLVVRVTGLLAALLGVGAAPAAGSVLIGSDLSATPAAGSGASMVVQTTAPATGVAGGGLLDVGRDDPDVAELASGVCQGTQPGAVDPVIVGDKNAHGGNGRG